MDAPTKAAAVIGGALAGFALLAALIKRSAAPAVPAQRRVVLVGDSLAVGLGPQLAKLARQSGADFRFEGHVGSTVAQWLATPAWGAWVAGFGPTATLIQLGTNDYRNPSPNVEQYRQFAAKFPSAVWIMPPDEPAAPMPKVRAAIEQVGVPVIPAATGLQYGADGIHPTPAGFAAWAASVWAQTP